MVGRVPARVVASLVVVLVTLSACGGGGGAPPVRERLEVNARGRVVAGGIGGSTLDVYRVGDYGSPVATVTTSTGASAAEIGTFSFSLPDVPADAMFLLVATGGTSYDEDEDGVLDAPTPSLGKVHALATASQLDGQDVRLSAVTEVVYHRVRYFLQAGYDDAFLARACDAWARFVLRASVAGDPGVDAGDALSYDPVVHASATFRRHQDFLDFVQYTLLGTASTPDAFYLSEPEMNFQVLPTPTFGIDLVGDRAYVCRGWNGLDVWDVSDPTFFSSVGSHDSPGQAGRVQVVGTLAYLADGDAGLRILDVSNPASIALVGSLDVAGPVTDLHVVGDRAYLCDSDGLAPALHVVDVSTPANPALLGSLPAAEAPREVRVEGRYAYVMESGQVEVVDVDDPTLPVSRGAVDLGTPYAHLDVGLGHLFVAADDRLEVFALATAQALPQPVATLALPGFGTNGLRVRGSQALVARTAGVLFVDVGDPAHPELLGVTPTTGGVLDVARQGGLLMVTEVNGGLAALAAAAPPPSGVVATVAVDGFVGAVDATPGRVHVTVTNPGELVVFDTSDPLAPVRVADAPQGPSAASDVVVAGGAAFVAQYEGLDSYDVSAWTPSWLDADGTRGDLSRLAAGPGVVYASSGTHLEVYDVSSPEALDHVASVAVGGQPRGLAYEGGVIVLAAGAHGVVTYDASTPSAPVEAGHVSIWETLDVDLAAPYAYVTRMPGWWNRGDLMVVDCSALNAPNVPSYATLPGPADQVARAGSFVYVSGWATGVNVVDVSDPTDAVHVGTIPVPASVTDLDAEGGWIYVSAGYPSGGLHVLRAATTTVP